MAKETKLERYLKFQLEHLTGSKYANCPFCGHKPRAILSMERERHVGCINKDCALYNHAMPEALWEIRVSESAPKCEICGRQAEGDEIGGCNKCSLTVCEDCISKEGWCLECVYDFGKGDQK